jgi:hypothetical protein
MRQLLYRGEKRRNNTACARKNDAPPTVQPDAGVEDRPRHQPRGTCAPTTAPLPPQHFAHGDPVTIQASKSGNRWERSPPQPGMRQSTARQKPESLDSGLDRIATRCPRGDALAAFIAQEHRRRTRTSRAAGSAAAWRQARSSVLPCRDGQTAQSYQPQMIRPPRQPRRCVP